MECSDQECLCRIIPSQPLAGLQRPSPTAPRGWEVHGVDQIRLPYAHNSAHQASYPYPHHDFSQANLPQAPVPNSLYQAPSSQSSPNGMFSDQFSSQSYITNSPLSNVPHSAPAPQQDLIATIVASPEQGSYTTHSQPKPSCCSSQTSSNQKSVLRNENQNTAPGMLNGSAQSTMYHIPAAVATYDNPMKPEHQTELEQSSPDYMQTVPAYAESGVVGMAALPAEASDATNCAMDTTHICHCGTGCQCMACPVHPGNATTKARVADLYEIIDNEPPFSPPVDEFPAWPSSHEPIGAMANSSHQACAHLISSEAHALGQQFDFTPYQVGDHWSEPSVVSYPQGGVNENLTNPVNRESNKTAPSQNYLHFQFPVTHVDGNDV